ncbi:MAG: L,D-transpeptidase family protein [Candidatus Binatia bacterium]
MTASLEPDGVERNRSRQRSRGVVTICVLVALGIPWLTTASAAPVGVRVSSQTEVAQAIELVRRAPLRAAGFVELATVLFQHDDVARAVAAAREATRLEPDVAAHHRLLGYLCAARGMTSEAEAAFARAAELDPSAHAPLADFRLAQAWAEYQQSLRLGPPDAAVDQRLRAIAALAAGAPELEMLLHAPWTMGVEPAPYVPQLALFAPTTHALVVEKRSQTVRLYGRRDDALVLLRTYPCTTGQAAGPKAHSGDRRTPDGVYVVTDLRAGSRLPGNYGALAMTLNYPNAWDRQQRRGGYGIWIHGSDRLAAPFNQRDTRGCVLMRNEDLSQLATLVTPGVTPVVIAEEIPYAPAAAWRTTLQQVLERVPAAGVLAVAATAEYTMLIRQEGAELVHDFVRPEPWRIAASERTPPIDNVAWHRQLADVVRDTPAWIVRVGVQDELPTPSVVIETSSPITARGFLPDGGSRLFLDLPGVRPGPVPARIAGDGPWVRAVTVTAASLDPPIARVAIDLRQPAKYGLMHEGNAIVVSLGRSK